MKSEEISFRCMGSTMRIVCRDEQRRENARRYLHSFDERLSRFRAESELCALNRDRRETVPASALLRAAVSAALWAAEATDGLIDPTLIDALEEAGYDHSLAEQQPQALGPVLEAAPARRPGAADPRDRWRQVHVDQEARVIRRPAGVRLDLGGTGKGLAADACAVLLAEEPRFAIDCGGDVRVGGADAQQDPFEVAVAHPLTGRIALTFPLIAGGVATSGIDRRVWRRDNRHGHHLIDPATGRPVWSGLIGATAVAPTTLEADVLAKAAVLAGAEQGRVLLRAHGGVLFHEGGHAERVAWDSSVAQHSLEPYRVAA